jgi:hypothetical protein
VKLTREFKSQVRDCEASKVEMVKWIIDVIWDDEIVENNFKFGSKIIPII